MLERGKPPRKWVVTLCVVISVASMVAGWAGDLFLAAIVDKEPLLLIGLNPRNRNLILATNQLAAIPYFSVGFLRLIATDPVNYLLGFWFGDRAIAWIERRSRTYGPLIRDGESLFRRASYPLIFLFPNNIICALAGATGVKVRAFAALNVSGTIVRLVLIRLLGERFEAPVGSTVSFITNYRREFLILSAIAVAWTIFGEFRGDNSELRALRELGEDEPSSEDDTENKDHTENKGVSDEEADR